MSEINSVSRIISMVFWDNYAEGSFLFGSDVRYERLPERIVTFQNPLLPPGFVIKEWKSRVNHQEQRFEAQLPILKEGVEYRIRCYYNCTPQKSVFVRLDFYDQNQQSVGFSVVTEKLMYFEVPLGTYSYTIQLIGSSVDELIFHRMDIMEAEIADRLAPKFYMGAPSTSRDLSILFPEVTGRIIRIPNDSLLNSIPNVMIVPPETMAGQMFSTKKWTQSVDFQKYRRINIICYGDVGYRYAVKLRDELPKSVMFDMRDQEKEGQKFISITKNTRDLSDRLRQLPFFKEQNI